MSSPTLTSIECLAQTQLRLSYCEWNFVMSTVPISTNNNGPHPHFSCHLQMFYQVYKQEIAVFAYLFPMEYAPFINIFYVHGPFMGVTTLSQNLVV